MSFTKFYTRWWIMKFSCWSALSCVMHTQLGQPFSWAKIFYLSLEIVYVNTHTETYNFTCMLMHPNKLYTFSAHTSSYSCAYSNTSVWIPAVVVVSVVVEAVIKSIELYKCCFEQKIIFAAYIFGNVMFSAMSVCFCHPVLYPLIPCRTF